MDIDSNNVGSTIAPSESHPIILRVEKELSKLKYWEVSSPQLSSSSTKPSVEMLCYSLCGLINLYDCLEELLRLPMTQQVLAHRRLERLVDEVLGGFLSLLDVCSIIRDVMLKLKQDIQDLQTVLRRTRAGEQDLENKVRVYISSRKNMKKEIERCLKTLKQSECRNTSDDKDQYLMVLINMLRESRSTTIFIFQSILLFVSAPKPTRKIVRRSLFSKWKNTRKVACEGEAEEISEVERVDSSLNALYCRKSVKDVEAEDATNVEKQLEALHLTIRGLVDGLDCLFRHLIQTKVSLLNILSN